MINYYDNDSMLSGNEQTDKINDITTNDDTSR